MIGQPLSQDQALLELSRRALQALLVFQWKLWERIDLAATREARYSCNNEIFIITLENHPKCFPKAQVS